MLADAPPTGATRTRSGLRAAFTAQEWRSIGEMTAVVFLLHVVGWAVPVLAVAPHGYQLGSTGVLEAGSA